MTKLKVTLKILVAASLIYWLVHTGRLNFGEIWAATSLTSLDSIFLIMWLGFFLTAERLRTLLRAFEIPLSRGQGFRLCLIGLFFNFIIPGGVGGDVVKGYYLHREGANPDRNGALAVLIDRVMGLYTILLIGAVSIVLEFENLRETEILFSFSLLVLVATVVATIIGIALFFVNVGALMAKVKKYLPFKNSPAVQSLPFLIETFFKSPGPVFKAMALSLCAQILFMITLAVAGHGLGFGELGLHIYMLIGALGFLISAIPITPAGIGVGQAAFLFVANSYLGHESTLGPAMFTIYQFVTLTWGLIGGLFYLQVKGDSFRAKKLN